MHPKKKKVLPLLTTLLLNPFKMSYENGSTWMCLMMNLSLIKFDKHLNPYCNFSSSHNERNGTSGLKCRP